MVNFLKKVTRQWVITTLNNLMGGYHSDLDEGLEDPGVTRISDADRKLQKVDFNYINGITPFQIGKLCDILKISMYAYDITTKCFYKQVAERPNHHYPALVYFCVNNHMFLIDKDAKTSEGHNYAQSLIKQAREIEVLVKSCLVDEEQQKKQINIFDLELPIIEDIPIQDLHKYNNHIIIYPKSNLNDELKDIIRYHNFIPAKRQMKFQNFKCVKIH